MNFYTTCRAITENSNDYYINVLQYLGLADMEELFLQPLNFSSEKSNAFAEETSVLTETTVAGLSVFPNPATNEVRIQYEALPEAGKVTLQIVDISGRTVFTRLMKNEHNDITVSLAAYNPGVHLVQISDENGTYAGQKLIISK